MHRVEFLQDLAVVMIVAAIVTIIFHRLRQPVVLGYILAGLVIGPHTPPFPLIQDQETIHTLSELGVVFLMFSLGLEFSFERIKEVGVTAAIAATLEILLMFFVGYEIGQFFAWSQMDSIFLGAMLSISSTTIIVKALAELGKTRETFARVIFGILIVEDILAIVIIAVLSGMAMTGSLKFAEVGATIGKLTVFLVTTMVIGLIGVPRLLRYVGNFRRNEMLVVTVLGLCFGVSLLAVKLGYSTALGAFLIGAIIAKARELGRIEALLEPIRDMFSAVFFVAIGLMIQPKLLAQYAVPILIITAAVIIGKIVTCAVGTFVAGHDRTTSLQVGMGLAQIGEFSFVIATLGLTLNVISEFLYPIAVTVSALTTLSTPFLIRSSDTLVRWFDRMAPRALVKNLDLYTSWVGEFGQRRNNSMAVRLLRKWFLQLLVNVFLMSGVFISAAYIGKTQPKWLPAFFQEPRNHIWLWLVSAIMTLPLFIASFRKLQAVGMLVADLKTFRAASPATRQGMQTIVSQVIAVTGTISMAILGLILSSALLPPLEVVLTLLLVLGLVTFLSWRKFVKVYATAQIALRQTLEEKPTGNHHTQETSHNLHPMLSQAKIRMVRVREDSSFAGKLIREIELRSRTGASIVAIQRQSSSMVNPRPQEEIHAGDELLLLGSEEQLQAADALFSLDPAEEGSATS
jgi:CPA2 family monovalent cation:H+ antiporter-2